MPKSDCIFCKIVADEVPSAKIYEDENILSFLDVGPLSDGHTLIIPKQHIEKMDECPADIMAKIAEKLPMIAGAVVGAMNCDGFNLLCNRGRPAGQLVDHLHFHIIPRNEGDGVFDKWPSYEYPEGKMQELAEKIRENF